MICNANDLLNESETVSDTAPCSTKEGHHVSPDPRDAAHCFWKVEPPIWAIVEIRRRGGVVRINTSIQDGKHILEHMSIWTPNRRGSINGQNRDVYSVSFLDTVIKIIKTVTCTTNITYDIVSQSFPFLSTKGSDNGISSSFSAIRMVDVTAACNLRASRTTASR